MTGPRPRLHRLPALTFAWLRSPAGKLALGFFAVAAALWLFLTVGSEMLEGETRALDRRLLLALRTPGNLADPIGPRGLEEAMRDITGLGGFTLMTVVPLVAVVVLWRMRLRVEALVMTGVVLLAQASANGLKVVYARPRPDLVPHGSYVYSNSFPSGHSSVSSAVFLILAIIAARHVSRTGDRIGLYALAVLLVTAIGLSRVYLGVHWPTDVVAGWTLGSGWAILGGMVLSRFPWRSLSAPPSGADNRPRP